MFMHMKDFQSEIRFVEGLWTKPCVFPFFTFLWISHLCEYVDKSRFRPNIAIISPQLGVEN